MESMVQEFANVVLIDKIVCPFSLPRSILVEKRVKLVNVCGWKVIAKRVSRLL